MTSSHRIVVYVRSLIAGTARVLAAGLVLVCAHVAGPLWGQTPAFSPCGTTNICASPTTANVGIGTLSPAPWAALDINTTGTKALHVLDTVAGGVLIGYQGASIQGRTGGDLSGNLYLNNFGGNVGIGTANPSALVDIKKDQNGATILLLENNTAGANANAAFRVLNDAGYFGQLGIYSSLNTYGALSPSDVHVYTNGVGLDLMADNANGVIKFATGGNAEKMRIASSGNVGIGTPTPQYPLTVKGIIGAREVIVTATMGADYVFKPEYHLRQLNEVSAYIKEHHHLPEIPSETEVQANGVSLGDMQMKLLAKIEELTLHAIQADERNGLLEQQNRELQNRMARLEAPGVKGGVNADHRGGEKADH